jgi:flavin reductase (DIM6/NTAB) family NADH-FMN oxidoreductase RutF
MCPTCDNRPVTTLPEEFDVPLTIGAGLSDGTAFDAIPDLQTIDVGELEGDPAIAFRRTLGMFATGVTVLTTRAGDQVHGMTANAFMSVSLSPPLVLISLDRRAKLCAMLHEGTPFGVSVLEAGQSEMSDHFAGRARTDTEPQFALIHDAPLVDGALAHVVARVVRSYWGGDHSLFLGQVQYARYGEGAPLLFHGGRYERLAQETQVLSELPSELLAAILALGVERRFVDGESLMLTGEPAGGLIYVVEGTVRVERPGRTIRLDAGAIVGEVAALDGGPRTADVYAEGAVLGLEVDRHDLLQVLETDPVAAIALIRILAGRFRRTP